MELIVIANITVAIVSLLYFLLYLWKQFNKPKSKNPFNVETVPIRPFVKDRIERKKVLRRAFKPDLVPENLDAIIIGSGVGGLSCAGLLSRSGKRVLVLEKHDRAGGGTHTYKSAGFEYDIGIHYVGDMEHGSTVRTYIDLLTDSKLDWAPLNDEFDTVVIDEPQSDKRSYNYVKGIKAFKKRLLEQFPDEEKAIDRLFELLRYCKTSTNALFLVKLLPKFIIKIAMFFRIDKLLFKGYDYVTQNSLQKVLDEVTDNNDLKTVFAYSFGDYGALPSQTCFLMHGMLTNHFLRSGGYYPVGGGSEIAFQMIPGIERGGGAVLVGAFAKEILVKNGVACGVRVHKTSNPGSEFIVEAPVVISNAGIYNTFNSLIPKDVGDRFGVMNNLNCVEPGVSCVQIMVGLNGTKEELGLTKKNYWIFTSNEPGKSTENYLAMSRDEAANADIPLLFLSFPSTKDPTWDERFPNKTTCAVIFLATLSWFDEWKEEKVKKRGQVYENLKSCFVNQAWNQVLRLFPNLKGKVGSIEGGTPLTHSHYLNSMHGELYGMHHSCERFHMKNAMQLRPETAIPGLYLTGQDIFTCGFSGACFAGLATASKILDRYLINDLLKYTKFKRKMK